MVEANGVALLLMGLWGRVIGMNGGDKWCGF